jgi:hypothetical protein
MAIMAFYINKAVRKYTKTILKVVLDCQMIRQMAEDAFCQKFPLLFEAFYASGNFLANDTYHIDQVLCSYAQQFGLERLVEPLQIGKDRIAVVLMVSDIWQALIKVEPQNDVWLPIATDTFIFPATSHKDLAYIEAQQLKGRKLLNGPIEEQSLLECLKHLEVSDF